MIINMISSGGGASAPRFGVATGEPSSSPNASLSFTNLLGEPLAFCVIFVPSGTSKSVSPYLSTTSKYMITHFVYDGVEISTGITSRANSNYPFSALGNGYNAQNNKYSFVYSSGTLTLSTSSTTASSGAFYQITSGRYELLYVY